MTTFCRSDHMRSPMIASAMTEHRISGQIGHPAASMMENTPAAPQKWRVTLMARMCFQQASSGGA